MSEALVLAPFKNTVVIAGGGTGGHIYPGIAIARALQKKHPEIRVVFVGARGGLEEKIVPREGFPLKLVEVGKLHHSVGLFQRLRTLAKLPLSLWMSARILRELDPVAVLGVGGFASGPILLMAALTGRNSAIWEPNAHPGLANRILSRFVKKCLVVFPEAARHLHARKIMQAGLPVRATMVPRSKNASSSSRPEAQASDGALRVLVFGGSQGARAINKVVAAAVASGGAWLEGVELIHQTGSADWPSVRDAYVGLAPRTQAFEYLHDMDARYAWADLIVCRSGASTVAEICACEKAAVFVPLPTAADDHQRKNAEALSCKGAAETILQNEFTPERFRQTIEKYRDRRELVAELEKKTRQFQFPDAAEKIVALLLEGAEMRPQA